MNNSTLIADTHVHIYPFYDTEFALTSALRNVQNIKGNSLYALFLTEKPECSFFENLHTTPNLLPSFTVKNTSQSAILNLTHKFSSNSIFLVAGKQIVTKEKIEVLALFCTESIPNELTLIETVEHIEKCSAIPVLNWGAGKWWFKRGIIIFKLLQNTFPNRFFIADTSLRPCFIPSFLLWYGRSQGFRMLAGSDPLYIKNEETLIGSYVSEFVFEKDFSNDPAYQLKENILNPSTKIKTLGKRNSFIQTARRIITPIFYKHKLSDREKPPLPDCKH